MQYTSTNTGPLEGRLVTSAVQIVHKWGHVSVCKCEWIEFWSHWCLGSFLQHYCQHWGNPCCKTKNPRGGAGPDLIPISLSLTPNSQPWNTQSCLHPSTVEGTGSGLTPPLGLFALQRGILSNSSITHTCKKKKQKVNTVIFLHFKPLTKS